MKIIFQLLDHSYWGQLKNIDVLHFVVANISGTDQTVQAGMCICCLRKSTKLFSSQCFPIFILHFSFELAKLF